MGVTSNKGSIAILDAKPASVKKDDLNENTILALPIFKLTAREAEQLSLVAQGITAEQAAKVMGVKTQSFL